MNPNSYPLDLFFLLHRKKSSQKREDNLNSASGFVIATFISIALWSLIFSIGLILF